MHLTEPGGGRDAVCPVTDSNDMEIPNTTGALAVKIGTGQISVQDKSPFLICKDKLDHACKMLKAVVPSC